MFKSKSSPLDWEFNDSFSPRDVREALGSLPTYLSASDMRGAITQLEEHSEIGWITEPEDTWQMDADARLLHRYFGTFEAVARATHMGETVYAYPNNCVAVLHTDNTFSVSRVI